MTTDVRTILITGCSSGFGELTARTLARAGYHIFAAMRGTASKNLAASRTLKSWAEKEGLRLDVVDMEVTSVDSVQGAVDSILASVGRIDVLVNNAGIGARGPLEAFSMDQIELLFDVNAFGPMRVSRAVLPSMRRNRSGLIVNVSSTIGRVLPESGGLYPATKWALEGLAESLSYEVKPFGIDVVIVEPGAFPSPALSRATVAENRELTAAYVAAAGPSRRAKSDQADEKKPPPDPQNVPDTIKRIIELPAGQRPLRTVVGRIFVEGVAEYNDAYERTKHRLANALQRPDQAITWFTDALVR